MNSDVIQSAFATRAAQTKKKPTSLDANPTTEHTILLEELLYLGFKHLNTDALGVKFGTWKEEVMSHLDIRSVRFVELE